MMEALIVNPLEHWIKTLMGEIKPAKVGVSRTFSFGVETTDDGARDEILAVVTEVGLICGQQLMMRTGYKKTTIYRVLDDLVDEGVLVHTRALYKNRLVKYYKLKNKPSEQLDLGL